MIGEQPYRRQRITLIGPQFGLPRHEVYSDADMSLRQQVRDALRSAQHIERHLQPRSDAGENSPCRLRLAIEALAAVTNLATIVDRWRGKLVRKARQHGAKWSEIGRALGTSRQAAHERYRRQTSTSQITWPMQTIVRPPSQPSP